MEENIDYDETLVCPNPTCELEVTLEETAGVGVCPECHSNIPLEMFDTEETASPKDQHSTDEQKQKSEQTNKNDTPVYSNEERTKPDSNSTNTITDPKGEHESTQKLPDRCPDPDCEADLTQFHDVDPVIQTCPYCQKDLSETGRPTDSTETNNTASAISGSTNSGSQSVDSITLYVRDDSFTTELNKPVGKRVRRSIILSGGDEDEATRVHRKHVLFTTDNGSVYVNVLGLLGIKVNGTDYEKDEEIEINDGDTITFNTGIEAIVEINRN